MIDYLTLMLTNMTAGLVLLSAYLIWGLLGPNSQAWSAGFAAVGLVALATGLHMSLTWPLRGSYNIAFGEPTVLLGAAFLAAAMSLAMGWRLTAVAVYGAVAGVMIVLLGTQIIRNTPPTKAPVLAGLGFIFTGLGAVLVLPAVLWPQWRWLRVPAVLLLLAGAAIWGVTAFNAYPAHLKGFAEWKG